MWLRNYDILKLWSELPTDKLTANNGYNILSVPYVRKIDGTRGYLPTSYSDSSERYNSILNKSFGTINANMAYHNAIGVRTLTIDVGTSDTAVDYEDYELKAPCVTGTSGSGYVLQKTLAAAPAVTLDLENNKYTVSVSIDFKNVTENDIELKEWGLYNYISNSGVICLIKREVLAESVTIAADTYKRMDFSYDVEFSSAMASWANPATWVGFNDTCTDTWAEIKAALIAGDYSSYAGLTKSFEYSLEGVDYVGQMMFADADHDTISGTENKAKLSLIGTVFIGKHAINTAGGTTGGWMGTTGDLYAESQDMTDGVLTYGCDMRKWIHKIVIKDADLASMIQIVDKDYNDSDGVNRKCKDKFWIPSVTELGGNNDGGALGTVYPIFTNDASRVRNWLNGGGEYWWSRSRSTGSYFWAVTSTGGFGYNNYTSYAYGCVLGFAISA